MDGIYAVNIMLIVFVLAVIGKAADGYKKGMVSEVVALITMIVLCLTVALVANGVNSYLDGKILNVMIMIILFSVLGIAHHFLKLALLDRKSVV